MYIYLCLCWGSGADHVLSEQLAMLTEEAKSLELEGLGRESRSAAEAQRRLQSRGSRAGNPAARGSPPSVDFAAGRSRNASQP